MVYLVPNSGISNCYLISGTDGLMAVDIGSIGAADALVKFINDSKTLFFSDVKYIAATHFHIDHIGGIGRFLEKNPASTKVLFHHYVRDYLNKTRKLSPMKNWISGLIPAAIASFRHIRRPSHLMFDSLCGIPMLGLRNIVRLPYGPDDWNPERITYLEGGSSRRYKLGFDDWEVIETPGHTEDSISFYNEATGELICGDLILNMGCEGYGVLNHFHWDKEAIVKSYMRLYCSIEPKVIYPGHGEVIRSNSNALRKVYMYKV